MSIKDQAETQSIENPETFDQKFDKGWDQVELLTNQENEAKAKANEPKPAEPPIEGDKSTPQTPFKVLKVQGKELPVYSEQELIELAQKGADYTKKTQTLADDRRTAEQQLKDEEKKLNDKAAELNATLDELMRLKQGKPKSEDKDESGEPAIDPEQEKIFQRFKIDPKYAQPHEVEIVKELAQVTEYIQQIKSRETEQKVREVIAKERETHPYEDIIDDKGQNITEQQLAAIISNKRREAEQAKMPMDGARWIKEAVEEVHLSQKKTREALSISDDMDPDTFAQKYPALAEKLKAKMAPAVPTPSPRSIVPPSLPATQREPTPRPVLKKAVAPPGKSLDDWLNEGFSDPDIIKALNGG